MEIVRVGKVVFIARVARSRADRQITAITASKLKGLKSANPGLTIKIIPKKPMRTASQRLIPTVSHKKIAAPAVIANGVPCRMAEAEDKGVSTIAPTKNNAPNKSANVLVMTCLSSRSRLKTGCFETIAKNKKIIEPLNPMITII